MEEEFRDVKGYEGLYSVSDLGRVKSLKRKGCKNDKILKGVPDPKGYLKVSLYKDGNGKLTRIHQLVAIAFLNHTPNGFKGLIVDHDDNSKLNNRLDNLVLRTNRDNTSKDKKGGTSEFRGVSWHKPANKWQSKIYINGKQKHLGLFKCETAASMAYEIALNNFNKSQLI